MATRKQPPVGDSEAVVYQMKVTLLGLKPPIWRRFLVSPEMNLGSLHEVLQTVMGWENAHLHEFEAGGWRYGPRDTEDMFATGAKNEVRCTVREAFPKEKSRGGYLYDFGDSWEHEIVLEKILPLAQGLEVPSCLDGKRACPPEDIGGVPFYDHALKIADDKAHPDHEMLDWLEGFDPERFEPEEVNKSLRPMRKAERKKSTGKK
jgi:hypothetical protein